MTTAQTFDTGACPPRNGEAAIGYTLQVEESPRREYSEHIGKATNNEAEYQALISGLRTALNMSVDDITARGDSQLVVDQVRGEWKAREPRPRKRERDPLQRDILV